MPQNSDRTIVLLSPCGWGNLGDAAIQDAVIAAARKRRPETQLIAATLNPADTMARHHIPAVTINGFSITPGYTNQEPDVATQAPLPASSTQATSERNDPQRTNLLSLFKKFTWPLRRPVYPLIQEIRHIRKSLRILENSPLLLASGGGQLDDYWGGSWGHPYALCKWSWLARRVGTPFAIVGVGTGSISNSLTRRFLRNTLKRAVIRSFRDQGSRDLVRFAAFTQHDAIVPDLAFGLDVSPFLAAPKPTPSQLHIGVSPIAYYDPRIWPDKDVDRYARHTQVMTQSVVELLQAGHRVSLYATDPADKPCVNEMFDAISKANPSAALAVPQIESVPQLLTLMSELDLVVASRLHGVIIACLMLRPTLAVSYDRKVETVMKDLDLADHCCQIDSLDKTMLLNKVRTLHSASPIVVASLANKITDYRRQLDNHFDAVFNCCNLER